MGIVVIPKQLLIFRRQRVNIDTLNWSILHILVIPHHVGKLISVVVGLILVLLSLLCIRKLNSVWLLFNLPEPTLEWILEQKFYFWARFGGRITFGIDLKDLEKVLFLSFSLRMLFIVRSVLLSKSDQFFLE